MKWRAWYSLEEVYDSDSTEWSQLPPTGLQSVCVFHEDGRAFYDGADWYWIYQGQFGYVASRDWGTYEPKPSHVKCQSCIKQGTALPDDEYQRIVAMAKEARGF